MSNHELNQALEHHQRQVPTRSEILVEPNKTSRRRLLRSGGVILALPWLDMFQSRGSAIENKDVPSRMVLICSSLGIYGPNLIPTATGRDYSVTPYLEQLGEHRTDVTVCSGLSHPNQSGSCGHSSERTWLTAAPFPGLGGFRNTISLDQLAVESHGYVTRFPSLVLGMNSVSQSYTRNGVMVPAVSSPSQLFSDLFLEGSADQIKQQVARLREGRSILDTVAGEAKRLEHRSSSRDQERMDEYFQSVRDMEHRLQEAEAWAIRPKPKVEASKPNDIMNERDMIGRMRLMFDMIPLALQTDSTRVVTMLIISPGDVPQVPGVSMDHHNLSHHGHDPAKLAQLALVEQAEFQALSGLIASLKLKEEKGRRLLDSTTLVFGSNLGNASSHDTKNLPIVVAGGGRERGDHIAFDAANNQPLSNLYLSLLHKQGIQVDRFGSSTGTLNI